MRNRKACAAREAYTETEVGVALPQSRMSGRGILWRASVSFLTRKAWNYAGSRTSIVIGCGLKHEFFSTCG
jgi:hypothetical protein